MPLLKPLAKPKSYLIKPAWVKPGWETYYWQLNRSIRIGPAKFDPNSPENNLLEVSDEQPPSQ